MVTPSWSVNSSSGRGTYLVRLHADGNYSCECQGWKFCKKTPRSCQHIVRVLAGEGTVNLRKEVTPFMKAKTKELGFQKPMLAEKLPAGFEMRPGEWSVEEKYDGHRLIVSVHGASVTAWARSGKERRLPDHIISVLEQFPSGTYDGELTAGPGTRSYHVTEKTKERERCFVVFDLLRLLNQDTTASSYDQRRRYLREIFKSFKTAAPAVAMAKRWEVDSIEEAMAIYKDIRKRDGEGIIIKRRLARYTIGKRTNDFLKVKALKHAVLTVVGFKPSKGKIVDRGPFGRVMLKDAKGNATSVKVLDDATLADLEQAYKQARVREARHAPNHGEPIHPYVGRKLCIDYQERTPDGGYRHPRWDRWEDE